MRREKPNDTANRACGEFEPLLILSAAGDELDSSSEAELAAHLAQCGSCSAALDSQRDLLRIFAENRNEPDASLLASCRASLEDALDREEERGWLRRLIGAALPATWLSPQPAWSAAVLVTIGFAVGAFGPRLLQHRIDPAPAASPAAPAASGMASASAMPAGADANPSSDSTLGNLDLHTADVAGISVFPSGGGEPPQVELQLNARQPLTLQGSVNNDDVKRVLLYVLGHNERFDPGERLDAVDLLCVRRNDPDVRSALCKAVHTDRNAAVRLKALDALNGLEPQEMVRQTLLDALVDDRNPGVRVEAINALREMTARGRGAQAAPDSHLISVLRDRMQKDPNAYIRLQSAAAIRDLSPVPAF